MAKITGSETILGIRQGSTYGTAVAIGAGHQLVVEDYNSDGAVTVGESNNIGANLSMDKSADVLKVDYTVSINQQARYNDGGLPLLLAAFLGASAAPVEQTTDEDDYMHRLTWSPTANKFLTVAAKRTTTEVIEFPSCYVTDINIETGETNGYLTYSASLIASGRVLDSSTNTAATMANATVLGSSIIAHNKNDYLWINAQGGDALDSGDAVCPNSLSISFSRPKSVKDCFGGTAISIDGMFDATLTLNFPTLDALTFFTAFAAGTEYKALFNIQGNAINAGDNEAITVYFPRLKLVTAPSDSVADAGDNGYTLVFKGLAASANPTGMNSVYPYVEFVNGNSATILS
jgi:hypothetical protein